jgi:3-isopropylmalate/(R)-2-methylmalate dehydratase small subunit
VTISFEVDPFRKKCLLEGLDDIGLTLEKSEDIAGFEETRQASQPWL